MTTLTPPVVADRHPHREAPAAPPSARGGPRAALIALSLVGLCSTAMASSWYGNGTCPGSPSLGSGSGEPARMAATGPRSLLPGQTVPTRGTNTTESPSLIGVSWDGSIDSFSIATGHGRIKGTLYQNLVNADNGTCDCQWLFVLDPDSLPGVRVTGLQITNFHHPKRRLRADFIDLPPGPDIGSDRASRSAGAGTTIRFDFDNGVGPGEASRVLFLDTNVGQVDFSASVQLLFSDGSVSRKFVAPSPIR